MEGEEGACHGCVWGCGDLGGAVGAAGWCDGDWDLWVAECRGCEVIRSKRGDQLPGDGSESVGAEAGEPG
jgi:hypothetical protein